MIDYSLELYTYTYPNHKAYNYNQLYVMTDQSQYMYLNWPLASDNMVVKNDEVLFSFTQSLMVN